MSKKFLLPTLLGSVLLNSVAIAAPALAQSAAQTPSALDARTAALVDKAISGDHRSAANKARDAYRHPKETLAFFGLKSNMTVVEIAPGGGWYTEILAPVLRDNGKYYAAHNDPNGGGRRGLAEYLTKLAETPELYKSTVVAVFSPTKNLLTVPEGSADLVLTFRNVHNWMAADAADKAFKSFFNALKPGGVLGVVDHRWPEDKPQDPKARNGYVKESEVIRMAEAAGFKFVGKSEINANPKDTKDYEAGVWTLPPVVAAGNAEKYGAIGESDRMTLKFVKP